MNRNSDSSWILVISFMTLIGILYIPTFNDGFCINIGDSKESAGVCTRNWMQSIGTMLIPLAALYFTVIFKRNDEIKNLKSELINSLQVVQQRMIIVENLHNSFQEAAEKETEISIDGKHFYANLNHATKLLYKLGNETRISELDITDDSILDAQRSLSEFIYQKIGYIENEINLYAGLSKEFEIGELASLRHGLETRCLHYIQKLREIEEKQVEKIRNISNTKFG